MKCSLAPATSRENASKSLIRRYAIYEDLIKKELERKPSLEIRKRLERIVTQHADLPRITKAIAALELLHDSHFLVSLLDDASAAEVPLVIQHLEKTTKQKLGNDPAAWKKWANKQQKP